MNAKNIYHLSNFIAILSMALFISYLGFRYSPFNWKFEYILFGTVGCTWAVRRYAKHVDPFQPNPLFDLQLTKFMFLGGTGVFLGTVFLDMNYEWRIYAFFFAFFLQFAAWILSIFLAPFEEENDILDDLEFEE